MTSKLLRTTSVFALTALAATAVIAIRQPAHAEPQDQIRLAQASDTVDPKANVDAKKGDGAPGDKKKRFNNGQQGGGQGGGPGGGQGNNKGAGQFGNKPPAVKVTKPKPPPAKPIVKPVIQKPIVKPVTPPVKTAVPPPPQLRKSPPGFVPPDRQNPSADVKHAPSQLPRTPAAVQPIRKPVPVPAAHQPQVVKSPPPRPVIKNLNEAKSRRIEVKEDGGRRTVIKEADKRTIVKQGDKVVIQKDEAASWRRVAPGAVVTRDKRGRDKTVVQRRDNTQVITETDRNGQLLRRYRRDRDGRETIIIDNRRRKDNFGRNLAIGVGVGAGIIAGAAILNSVVDVPPPRVRVPRDKYIVDYERASEEDVYEALNAPPVDDFDGRGYTLDQIRATPYLRERMRRVDLDDITFETGSWEIDPSQYRKLERIARAMKRVIDRNPNEVFMIEGYTDAVGSDVDNLTLSDRRAESVAVVLSEEFEVPFENLTTQGYGEEYLKIPTDGPERQNRRVAARRITPLLEHDNISAAPPPPPPPPPTYREERRWRRYN